MNLGEEYYTSGNYTSYLDRKERYLKLAEELDSLLKKLNLIHKDSVILDFGCAVGFLLEGFKELGYTQLFGVETSDWARNKAKEKGFIVIPELTFFKCPYEDIIFALDVFEHMRDCDIEDFLRAQIAKTLIVRIPVARITKGPYILDVSNKDKTHINAKTKEDWVEFIMKTGAFKQCLFLNLSTIYDSEGVFCGMFLR